MKLLLAALAAVSLAAPAFAEDVSPETLREIGDRFDQAQIGQDRAAMEAMTSEGLVFVGSDGRRQSRADFIAGWMDPNTRYEPITVEDRYFLPLGPDTGVVGGDVVVRGTSNGQPFAAHIRFADTFRRIDGTWRAVHIQATRVPAAR
ncbi:nuclear transport factor 2 family protein [Sphingosinicella sp. LHD-64]|uniref:nuclear transport factor 2 family protein n=1 Tax=Sphingosinicella sp. LHD-64 TaxID=3072139 RepID=UPI00280ECB38|nr:nuclear transport factor 2 family protein [Sphingosinicella sp. LHD-64]MDQ8755115.1 nuclear transport factor 2 family protein [Sphingosinicella sp. LHD-64]